jgi:Tol biopolymer transport system component
MKHILVFFILAGSALQLSAKDGSVAQVHISKKDQISQPMRLFLGIIGAENNPGACSTLIATVKRCLESDGMFTIHVETMKSAPNKKSTVKKLFKQEYDCALFLTFEGDKKPIEWRIYDTLEGSMVKGKRHQDSLSYNSSTTGGAYGRTSAHVIAEDIVQELTGVRPPFSTKLAYRKQDVKKKKSLLCVADFDGLREQVIIQSNRIIVAPEWNNDPGYPCIVFSEFTPSNVRLVMTDLNGHKRPLLDVDGTTVGISYAPWSDEVAYCRSGDIWHYHYDEQLKKGIHKLVIRDKGTCASPQLLESGDIIYCCSGKIKLYHTKDMSKTVITSDGYCVGPSYSNQAKKLVYSQRIDGSMQLFVGDIASGEHRQITFASKKRDTIDYRSDKVDPCWAPDGVTAAFCWERDGVRRIAIINTITGTYRCITPAEDQCSYPAWSCYFE